MVLKKIQSFFSKKPNYFSGNPSKFWTFWETLPFQSHSTASLQQFVGKNFQVQKRERTSFNMNVIRKLG